MYQGKTFMRDQEWYGGNYLELDCYSVFQAPGKRRKKCRPTKDIQRRLNQRNAERRLIRLIRRNFGSDDLVLHVTYRPECLPAARENAAQELKNYLARLRRLYRSRGMELKYITSTEYGKKGRVHHHIILNGGVSRDELERAWGKGYANTKRLQMEDDGAAALATYVCKDRAGYRRWNSSRNLIRPEPETFDARTTVEVAEELCRAIEEKRVREIIEKLYPEYILLDAQYLRNFVNNGRYLRFELRKRRSANGASARGVMGGVPL